MSGELISAALVIADRLGAGVVPINGKRPMAEHGYASASTDALVIRKLFQGVRATGVGIAAGDRFVILDVDRGEALDELGPLPETLTARSGSGRGVHQYFLRPPGLTLSYRRDRLPLGVEVKLGAAGTVAPPSVHPSGGRYEWVRRIRPVEAPSWLLESLAYLPPASPTFGVPTFDGETAYGRAALERKTRQVASAAEGCRQSVLNSATFALAQLVPSGHLRADVIADVLSEAALAAGLPAREVRSTMSRALVAGQSRPYFPRVRHS